MDGEANVGDDVSNKKHYPMDMSTSLNGTISIEVTDADENFSKELLLVVSAMPDHFYGHQTYGYQVRIRQFLPGS